MKTFAALGLALAACGAPVHIGTTTDTGASAPTGPGIVFARSGAVLVPLACGFEGTRDGACLAHVPPNAPLLFDDGHTAPAPPPSSGPCVDRSSLAMPGAGRVAAFPPGGITPVGRDVGDLAPAELARVRALVAKSLPDLPRPAEVEQVVRADLDGDGKADVAYVASAPGFHAVAGATAMAPELLRFLQFSDEESYEILAVVTLRGPYRGRQLVVAVSGPRGVELEVLRATGEIIGAARCAP
jgi:hypothetical protein